MPARPLYGCLAVALMALVVGVTLVVFFRSQEPDTSGQSGPKTDAPSYVVKRGDALSLIAEKTGVEEDRLEDLNPDIDPLGLVPGQRIKLRPLNARERALARRRARARRRGPRKDSYVLRQGDLLSEVAKRNDVDLIELLDLNPQIKRPDRVLPGQRIRLR
jgi:LysM repeat protein